MFKYTFAHMERPQGITAITILLSFATIATYSLLNYRSADCGQLLTGALLGTTTVFLILGNFWYGFNWARQLILLYCLVQLMWPFRLLYLVHEHPGTKLLPFVIAVNAGKTVIAIYLLWFLNTREVRHWFESRYK